MIGRGKADRHGIFLIDANNFLYRAYHALPMLTAPDGTPVHAVHGFVRMIQALRRDHHPEYFAVIFDAGGRGARHEMYPEYKAQRPPPPDDLKPQFALVRQATDALGLQRIERRGIEADDLIASYVKLACARGLAATIVSSDKDLMQLVDEEGCVFLLDTMKNVTIGPDQVMDKYGVPPMRLGDLLALVGDTSDNVPGVPGIGPKTAAELLREHGDLEGVLAATAAMKPSKRRDNLIAHADDARLSRKLVELERDLELPLPIEALRDQGPDPAVAREFFGKLGFTLVLRELGTAASTGEGPPSPVAETPAPERPAEPARVAAERRTILAGQEEDLRALVAELRAGETVAVQVLASREDPLRAEIVGLALSGGKAIRPVSGYVPVGHLRLELGGAGQPAWAAVREIVAPLLSDPRVPKVADDSKNQSMMLGRAGIELAGVVMDPMLGSYVDDPSRTSHALEDRAAELLGVTCMTREALLGKGRSQVTVEQSEIDRAATFAMDRAEAQIGVGRRLRAAIDAGGPATRRLLDEIELPLAGVLRKVEERGILLDIAAAQTQAAELDLAIQDLRRRIEADAGWAINPDSPQQLQRLLFEERGLPTGKKIKTGFSTDASVLEELAALDPIVGLILEYRTLTKLKSTYLDPLPSLVNPTTGRLHTHFRQAVAQTGRLSSVDPNLQNIPIRTDLGRRIRAAFVAPPGMMLVSLDYSQIELRILAHLSRDPALVSAFVDGVDVHRRTAAEVFEVADSEVTDEQRRIAKAVNFGVIYGQTAFGLSQQLGIPRGKAASYIRTYFERIPAVDRYMNELIAVAKEKGYAETILGRKRKIPELRSKGAARGYGERIARNTPLQGSAADVLKLAMIAVEKDLESFSAARMLLTVHDELIFECEERHVEDLVARVKPLMEEAVEISVPLSVEWGQGRSWDACKG